MNTQELIADNFEQLQARMTTDRLAVHRAWLAHGPGTTREVAAKSQIDLLTFRPRSTDLYQIGALELIKREKHEGIYRARDLAAWEQWHTDLRAGRITSQQQLI